jgi:hypothetical protein
MSSGLHFTSNPATVLIQLCTFNDGCGYAITGDDITSAVTVTNVDYAHNVQQNGLSSKIQTLCPIKNVGCHATDRYATLQDAISSVPVNGVAIVYTWQDYTGLAKLTMPNTGTQITINGQKKYSLAFTGDIVDITGSQHFGFVDMVKVDGDTIKLNGATAEVSLESSENIVADLVIDAGASSTLCRSALFGSTGNPAITVNSLTTTMVVGYSKIEGPTGQPAMTFTVEADNKFKAKFSTFIHGTGGTNKPITYSGSNKLDYAMYNSALNASLDTSIFSNTIGSPNNTTSGEIDF